METLKYTVIKSKAQYNDYCKKLEKLAFSNKTKSAKDEMELLTFLVEKWDEEHNSFHDVDPIELLHSLMEEKDLKAKNLVEILQVSKGFVSDLLHYKKGLSKEVIRTLSEYFKVSQEAFNRPYKLKSVYNSHLRNASVMSTPKELAIAR